MVTWRVTTNTRYHIQTFHSYCTSMIGKLGMELLLIQICHRVTRPIFPTHAPAHADGPEGTRPRWRQEGEFWSHPTMIHKLHRPAGHPTTLWVAGPASGLCRASRRLCVTTTRPPHREEVSTASLRRPRTLCCTLDDVLARVLGLRGVPVSGSGPMGGPGPDRATPRPGPGGRGPRHGHATSPALAPPRPRPATRAKNGPYRGVSRSSTTRWPGLHRALWSTWRAQQMELERPAKLVLVFIFKSIILLWIFHTISICSTSVGNIPHWIGNCIVKYCQFMSKDYLEFKISLSIYVYCQILICSRIPDKNKCFGKDWSQTAHWSHTNIVLTNIVIEIFSCR